MDLKVECLRVKADCELPAYLVARSGLGDHREGLADVAGHAGWTHTTVKGAKGQQVDLPILCGIQDHAYHGEKLIEYDDVSSNCACKQLCTDQIDEGCEAWKWYRERRVCQLLSSVFEVGAAPLPTESLRDATLPTGWW